MVTDYPVPQNSLGSSDRGRIGDVCYQRMAEASIAGFMTAVNISILRGHWNRYGRPASSIDSCGGWRIVAPEKNTP